jgi:hypothetical protein
MRGRRQRTYVENEDEVGALDLERVLANLRPPCSVSAIFISIN